MYTIAEFYACLKLHLFRQGEVKGWGYISDGKDIIQSKPMEYYQNRIPVMQLVYNIDLLDFYLESKKQKSTYVLVISVSDHFRRDENRIYIFKLETAYVFDNLETFRSSVKDQSGKRKSVFRKKTKRVLFNASPLNSISRKY